MSSTILNLLKELHNNGVKVEVSNGKLTLKATKPVAPELIQQLKDQKEAIIAYIEKHQTKNDKNDLSKVTAYNRASLNKIPLSFSQERLWFLDQLQGSTEYHMPFMLRLDGDLNILALEKSLLEIVSRHEVLRTVLTSENGVAYQKIIPANLWLLQKETITEDSLNTLLTSFVKAPFNLSEDFTVRAKLFTLNNTTHYLACVFHHIAGDGWSKGIFVNELTILYHAFANNITPVLPRLAIQFSDYAIWQRSYVEGQVLDNELAYWRKKLAGTSNLQIPTDFSRPAIQSKEGANVHLQLNTTLTTAINELCQQQDVTLFMALLAGFKVLMSRYSNQKDICIGTPIANRTQTELEGLIGFFTNTLALRSNLEGNPNFDSFLQEVKKTTLEGYDHQLAPFEKVVDSVIKGRDMSMSPLFQVMLVVNNTPESTKPIQLENVIISTHKLPKDSAKFDLILDVAEIDGCLELNLEYCTALFKESTAQQLLTHFKELLTSITNNISTPIEHITMLTQKEVIQLTQEFNTSAPYPHHLTVIDLFKNQVQETPNEVALVFQDEQLTYAELDTKTDQLAGYLLQKGALPNQIIGLCIERSLEMVLGVLAILKTGAAYVPIDPEYPQHRIDHMVEDSGIQILVTSNTCKNITQKETITPILLDSEWEWIAQAEKVTQSLATPENTAYLIYTSGSTGKPKGVVMPHKALFNLIYFQKEMQLPGKKVTQFTSISFDVSFQEIFYTLSQGKELHIVSEDLKKDALNLKSYIQQKQIDTLYLPTSFFNFFGGERYFEELPSVKNIFVAGEQLKVSKNIATYLKDNDITLHNHYGPSEAHVVTTYELNASNGNVTYQTPCIGHPVPNTQIYMLDAHQQLVPLGVSGELCIGGTQVANGYLNRADLTNEKFIDNPFKPGEKLYRTGDLAKWATDGTIIFLGRIDNQVKVRGYRIELGEIENALATINGITECCVLAQKDERDTNRLVAYVVTEGSFEKETIQNTLKELLPDYMVPNLWIPLDVMPLTPNGKIDKKALPAANANALLTAKVSPKTPQEIQLATIWEHLLKITEVGIHDNFFELGGHSLLATRLVSMIRKELEVEVAIRDIFQYPTIAQLAHHLSKQHIGSALPPVTVQERPSRIPLSFNQERLWFLDQYKGSEEYDMSLVLRLEGNVNPEKLEQALKYIIARHEILRTMILSENGKGYQEVASEDAWSMKKIQLTEAEVLAQIKKLSTTPFDLAKDYKLKATLIQLSDQEFVLACIFHHIVGDGWSKDIFFREFSETYKALVSNQKPQLPALAIQYADYAIWQRTHVSGTVLNRQLQYWEQKLKGVANSTLPLDFPRPAIQSTNGSRVVLNLSSDISSSLKHICKEEEVTLFMVLLAAFKVVLTKWSNQSDICVGTPIANRTQAELESMIGFFVNTLALRSDVSGNPTFKEFLASVKETTLEAYEYQLAPFEKIVDKILNQRDLSMPPLFQVSFVLQNTPDDTKELLLENTKVSSYHFKRNSAKFDLTLNASETDNGITLAIEYCTDLFKSETIERLQFHIEETIKAIVNDISTPIHQLSILPQQEKELVLHTFNDNAVKYPNNITLISRFAEIVEMHPHQIAVVYENEQLTYQQLDEKSNQLAQYLLANYTIGHEDLINVILERSDWYIVAILAILKTGAAFVPIDPNYPTERKNYIKEDSNSQITIDYQLISNFITSTENYPKTPVDSGVAPNSLAYIIYTSGSTGNPKGVMIEHQTVLNTLLSQIAIFEITPDDRCLQFASSSFDASISEIFITLLSGSSLFVIKEGHKSDISYLRNYIAKHHITLAKFPPAFLQLLSVEDLTGLRALVTAGEAISYELAKKFSEHYTYFNGYGPTETSICATTFGGALKDRITIGTPVPNTQVYITDDYLNPLPIGVTGELCITGNGVGRGYFNREDLTNEKFVHNPFNTGSNHKLYKTGDLARWLPDGTIEFIGRKDDQVKIRGYRIELGEVQFHVNQLPEVKQSVVLAKPDSQGTNQLISYLIPEENYNEATVRETLQENLPGFMIPSIFVTLEKFPITTNGKVDKKALLLLNINEAKALTVDEAANETQEHLIQLWKEVLDIEDIGIHHNFFEIGGNSILAIQLVAKLQKYFKLEINDLFKYPTIAELSEHISYAEDFFKSKVEGYITELKQLESQPLKKETVQPLQERIQKEKQEYLETIQQLQSADFSETITYQHILLFGATGYLGINLLHTLLASYEGVITVIVRGKDTEDATKRLVDLYDYYFQQKLPISSKLHVLVGDLTAPLFGIPQDVYHQLYKNVDCVINAAANAKHYGSFESFQKSNVYPVEGMISFASEGIKKTLHHVSTLSISGFINPDAHNDSYLFTEEATQKGQLHYNFYTQSKLQADTLLDNARKKGITANIYRVGNLSFNSTNGSFQKNIDDNAFYSRMKSYLALGFMPTMQDYMEISCIDKVAEAMLNIFNKPALYNKNFHIRNTNLVRNTDFVSAGNINGYPVSLEKTSVFFEKIMEQYDQKKALIDRFLLHSSVFDDAPEQVTPYTVCSEETDFILSKLGFQWNAITANHIKNMLDYGSKIGFWHLKDEEVSEIPAEVDSY